jgi:hypothetical protein|tara:strand:+ start:2336 stop:2653 length:318 start_codon:yes stop_codon:yes gene_type:complete
LADLRARSVSASSSTQRCPINIKVVDVSALLIEGYRPDEIAEAAGTDVLKLDMQGAELVIIENTMEPPSHAVVVETVVEFVPLCEWSTAVHENLLGASSTRLRIA